MNKIMQYKNGIPIKSYKSVMEIQKKTGYSRSHISECLNGKRKTAYGYEWEYQPRIKGKWKYWFKSKNEMLKDVAFLCDGIDRKDKQLEAYEKENQRLNNVLNELEKMFDSDEHFEDGCYCCEIEKYLHELKESDK